jgi:flagellar hook-basal body complex protein FliE
MALTPIAPIPPILDIAPLAGAKPAARPADPFGKVFQQAVGDVERFQAQAHASAERFLNGESEEVHQVALDAQRAELAMDLFLQTRNRVVEAYQEIMRMQL